MRGPTATLGVRLLGAALALVSGCALPYGDKSACREPSDCLDGYLCVAERCVLESARPDAAPPAGCAERTQGPGDPEGEVPAAAVHLGSVAIFGTRDLAVLDGIRVITGDLEVVAPALESLELPALEVVGRNLSIAAESQAVTRVALPRLETVGGLVQLSAPAIAELALPRLDSVGASYEMADLPVERIELPCMISSGGPVRIAASSALSVRAPRLARTGGLGIVDGRELLELELPALTAVAGDLSLERLPELRAAELPNLERIERTLSIQDDVSLRAFDLGALTTVGPGPHVIARNHQLPTCQVEALRDRLAQDGSPAAWDIRENGSGTDTCH